MTKRPAWIALLALLLLVLPASAEVGVPGRPEDAVPVLALRPAGAEPGVPAGPEAASPVRFSGRSAPSQEPQVSPSEAVPAREAAREAMGLGETQGFRLPVPGPRETVRHGTVRVEARGGYSGETFIPVRHIRISEVGRYRKRTYQTFSGDWFEASYSHSMRDAVVGRSYLVEVTWADGASSSDRVHLDHTVRVVNVWR